MKTAHTTVSTGSGAPPRQRYFIIADHLGSKRAIIDADSKVQARFDYDPYGMVCAGGPANASKYRYLYTGQEYEPELGLYNYRARMYDPLTARFISPDPAGQGFSPYMYCGNDPVNFADPTGSVRMVGVPGKSPHVEFDGKETKKIKRLYKMVFKREIPSKMRIRQAACDLRIHFFSHPEDRDTKGVGSIFKRKSTSLERWLFSPEPASIPQQPRTLEPPAFLAESAPPPLTWKYFERYFIPTPKGWAALPEEDRMLGPFMNMKPDYLRWDDRYNAYRFYPAEIMCDRYADLQAEKKHVANILEVYFKEIGPINFRIVGFPEV